MKILITAGPTREFMDPVRFLSNRSSGKMGYALAGQARKRGHEVVLVSGPVALPCPEGVTRLSVTSAAEMLAALEAHWDWAEALIMAAAVADWRPCARSERKLKKTEMSATLELERTPDILHVLCHRKGSRILVGFAAETDHVLEEAARKLAEKGLDLIAANDVSRTDAGFEADTNQVVLLAAGGAREDLPLMSKDEVALRIIQWVEERKRA